MSDDWDEEDSQRTRLQARLETIPVAPKQPRSLNELLYTASETSIIDFGISEEDALTIWKLVELAKSFGDTCPQELRM
ncbi:hypothetical protein D3C85_1262290 [compost metagenome]